MAQAILAPLAPTPTKTKTKRKGKATGKSAGGGHASKLRAELLRAAKQEARLARIKPGARKAEPKRPDNPRGQTQKRRADPRYPTHGG